MKILTGSCAAHFWIPEFRIGNDIDWMISEGEEVKDDSGLFPDEVFRAMEDVTLRGGVVSLNDLMTIKLSHLPYDIFWRKHLNDYLVFKKHGAQVNHALYSVLKEHWKNYHGNKPHLCLYRKKDEFFDDFVVKKYDHDYLHELVAYPDKPVYTLCLQDGQDVMIDKKKFFSLPFDKQLRMFREEVNVIACERWVLNDKTGGKVSFVEAYHKALHKTVTALTKGWASEFMCENIEHYLKPNKGEVAHLLKTCNVI